MTRSTTSQPESHVARRPYDPVRGCTLPPDIGNDGGHVGNGGAERKIVTRCFVCAEAIALTLALAGCGHTGPTSVSQRSGTRQSSEAGQKHEIWFRSPSLIG